MDLYNAISLRRLVPIGGHALDPIEGNISLCFAGGGETFIPMDLGEQETVEKGDQKENKVEAAPSPLLL